MANGNATIGIRKASHAGCDDPYGAESLPKHISLCHDVSGAVVHSRDRVSNLLLHLRSQEGRIYPGALAVQVSRAIPVHSGHHLAQIEGR